MQCEKINSHVKSILSSKILFSKFHFFFSKCCLVLFDLIFFFKLIFFFISFQLLETLNTSWFNTNQIKFIKILFHYPKTQINLLTFISYLLLPVLLTVTPNKFINIYFLFTSSSFTHCNIPRYFLTHQCANH